MYGLTVAAHITYILLRIILSTVSFNIFYLQYKVYGDQFCGLVVTGLEAVTYDLSVFLIIFELGEQTNTKWNT